MCDVVDFESGDFPEKLQKYSRLKVLFRNVPISLQCTKNSFLLKNGISNVCIDPILNDSFMITVKVQIRAYVRFHIHKHYLTLIQTSIIMLRT